MAALEGALELVDTSGAQLRLTHSTASGLYTDLRTTSTGQFEIRTTSVNGVRARHSQAQQNVDLGAYYDDGAGGGVDARLRVTSTLALVGTFTAHDFYIRAGGQNAVHLRASDLRAQFYGDVVLQQTLTLGGGFTFQGTNFYLTADTIDGADNKRAILCGGGAPAQGRGAYIGAHGNEYSTNPGYITLFPGSVAGARVLVGGDLQLVQGLVSAGANDSAGAGFRELRVPNA